MVLPLFRRRGQVDDPLAAEPEGTGWPEKLMGLLGPLVLVIFVGGGTLMLIGGIIYAVRGHPKPSTNYQWPIWGGVVVMSCGIPFFFLTALCLRPFKSRRERRLQERRRRRRQLIESNRVSAPLPTLTPFPAAANAAPPKIPSPVARPAVHRDQGMLEAKAWANDAIDARAKTQVGSAAVVDSSTRPPGKRQMVDESNIVEPSHDGSSDSLSTVQSTTPNPPPRNITLSSPIRRPERSHYSQSPPGGYSYTAPDFSSYTVTNLSSFGSTSGPSTSFTFSF